jgi:hypothetical protein
MKNAEPTPSQSGRKFIISRVFDVPRKLVWKAWTEPEHLKRWFGPKGFAMPTCSMDFRLGSVFHLPHFRRAARACVAGVDRARAHGAVVGAAVHD